MKKVMRDPHAFATARATSVLPVPGGPEKSTPRGGFTFSCAIASAYSIGSSTISFSSFTCRPRPPTQLQSTDESTPSGDASPSPPPTRRPITDPCPRRDDGAPGEESEPEELDEAYRRRRSRPRERRDRRRDGDDRADDRRGALCRARREARAARPDAPGSSSAGTDPRRSGFCRRRRRL